MLLCLLGKRLCVHLLEHLLLLKVLHELLPVCKQRNVTTLPMVCTLVTYIASLFVGEDETAPIPPAAPYNCGEIGTGLLWYQCRESCANTSATYLALAFAAGVELGLV